MPMDTFLRHPRFGIAVMVEVMNGWITEFGDRSDFTIVRYEDLRAEPARLFHELLRAIGEKQIDENVFGPAIDFSDFRNMQKLEAAGEFGSKILQPRDREDPESFKVRQGKVGAFRNIYQAKARATPGWYVRGSTHASGTMMLPGAEGGTKSARLPLPSASGYACQNRKII